ncbi:MAG: mitochondrial fission ELM1 family protein [Geminicoccaceae bacterium]
MADQVPGDVGEPRAASPRTWLLLGPKPGDNGQLLALAEALGWPFEVKRMAYRPWELLTNRLLRVTLLGLDRARSSPLLPPWPELILTAGRRNEPVARWVQARAGGRDRVRLVHVGRPWAAPELFDLIVSTPQYALPERANILCNEAPMHRVSAARLKAEAERVRPQLAGLPRPWTAVLLGGHVGPYSFDEAAAERLADQLNALAADGGALLLSTSARTPAATVERLLARLQRPMHLYRWRRDDPDNPYFGLLGLADQVVVTSDSMSMLIEAVATGKPVLIFDLGFPRPKGRPTRRALIFHLGRALGPARLRRDVGEIHRAQIAAGRAAWLGQPAPARWQTAPLADTERAAARVRAWFAPGMDAVARHEKSPSS